MNASSILSILQMISAAMEVAEVTGVNFQRLAALRAKAKAEGREINEQELKQLADESQAAIDAIKGDAT